jgi:hypothetical protein
LARKPKWRMRTKPLGSRCRRKRRRNSSSARNQYGASKLEALPDRSERIGTLNQVAQYKSPARVRNHIKSGGLVGQPFEQHSGVLFRGATESEMIEREYPVTVDVLHAIEEIGSR